jgi:hypothetical protein
MPGRRLNYAAGAGAAAFLLTTGAPAQPPPRAERITPAPNPCLGPEAAELLCPRLSIDKPRDMYFDRRHGRLVLRATNSINSVGLGPVEFRGTRTGPNTMSAVQRIYKVDGGHVDVRTGAHLGFKSVPGQYRYWKFRDAARFELWSMDSQKRAKALVRVGPKQYYCLRDLKRTRPSMSSPASPRYPRCNQNVRAKQVTLGTSVGWSDIYPSTYNEQWIDVTGLHGHFIYRLIVDPTGTIYATNRRPATSQRVVRIP